MIKSHGNPALDKFRPYLANGDLLGFSYSFGGLGEEDMTDGQMHDAMIVLGRLVRVRNANRMLRLMPFHETVPAPGDPDIRVAKLSV